MPIEKPGVGSPFHIGGGGGGGGAAKHVLVAGSNSVPGPHSAALLIPGATRVAIVNVANIAMLIARRFVLLISTPTLRSSEPSSVPEWYSQLSRPSRVLQWSESGCTNFRPKEGANPENDQEYGCGPDRAVDTDQATSRIVQNRCVRAGLFLGLVNRVAVEQLSSPRCNATVLAVTRTACGRRLRRL